MERCFVTLVPMAEKGSLRMPLILLFDIDGTLVRTGGAGKIAMEAALRDEFAIAEILDSIPYSGRTDRAIGRDLLAVHGIDPTPANQQTLHEGYLSRLPQALYDHPGHVCAGIEPLLTLLRPRTDVLLGLLTGNVRRGAVHKLGHYGLWDPFSGLGGFGDDHYERDDVARLALSEVETHLGTRVDPRSIWVIGDTPLDVKCARAIGANAVAVATGWHSLDELAATDAELVLPDLSDSRALFDRWKLA